MIVPMKQITLLVSAREREQALNTLRSLGVLHIKYVQQPVSDDINELRSKIEQAEKAEAALESESTAKGNAEKGKELTRHVLDLLAQKDEIQTLLDEKRETDSWFQNWGHVSLDSLEKLQQAGLYLRFYVASPEQYNELPEDADVMVIDADKSRVRFLYISPDPDARLDVPEYPMPDAEVSDLEKEIADLKKQLTDTEKELKKASAKKPDIIAHKAELQKQLEFENVRQSMAEEKSFQYLEGFIPKDQVDSIKKSADKEEWAYIIDDPDDPSQVPTLLRNKKPIRIIQPIYDFMGTLPGYHEMDVSFLFLLFFSIFYAMLVGDGGYGLIFLGGTIWAAKKYKNAPREPFILFYVLSICTIIWGLVTGTWFGSRAIAELPALNMFVVDQISSFNDSEASMQFMMQLTFIIGVVQLVLARISAALKKFPSLPFIAELGWVLILSCMYFVAKLMVLGHSMPDFALPLLIAGAVLVGLFANFQKNIIKGFFITLGNLPLDIISSFSDIVSYIRLFAVGIATVTVAVSFNEMAGGIMAPLVLVFGHGLNIILALMAVLVHGVRLNMLEFSGHLGMEWTGHEYKPFKE
ncbi:MAG: hypothetical protein U5R06_24525 [candidate division KSB1 bacterium]|nr:hypothetical protein [candidate division KSB1 bacterium]